MLQSVQVPETTQISDLRQHHLWHDYISRWDNNNFFLLLLTQGETAKLNAASLSSRSSGFVLVLGITSITASHLTADIQVA